MELSPSVNSFKAGRSLSLLELSSSPTIALLYLYFSMIVETLYIFSETMEQLDFKSSSLEPFQLRVLLALALIAFSIYVYSLLKFL